MPRFVSPALCLFLLHLAAPVRAAEPPFFPFCIDWHDSEKRTYAQQATLLKELGYPGVGHLWLEGVAERLASLDAENLRLFQITTIVEIGTATPAYDPQFPAVLALVRGRNVQFDLIIRGAAPSDTAYDARAVELIREMADLARESGSQLLLYPHHGDWLERTEDACRLAAQVDRPNVGIMFNLCHWLRVDPQRAYRPLLEKALPWLRAISINGADVHADQPGWGRYIQPLDQGNFDLATFCKTLKEIGYQGPIGLQCYGIEGDTRVHLTRSMAAWETLKPLFK